MKLLSGFLLGGLFMVTIGVWAGSGTLSSVSGGKVQTSHVNQFYSAFNQNLVPRNSSGVATDIGGDLGESALRWDDLFAKKLNIGASGSGLFIDDNSGTMRVGVGGSEQAEFSTGSKLRLGGSGKAYIRSYSSRSMAVSNSSALSDFPIVVSALTSTHGLMIVRGSYSGTPSGGSCGTLDTGEGFSCARTGTGLMSVTFTDNFAEKPACLCNTHTTGICIPGTGATNTVAISILDYTGGAPALQDNSWGFICIGQRGT